MSTRWTRKKRAERWNETFLRSSTVRSKPYVSLYRLMSECKLQTEWVRFPRTKNRGAKFLSDRRPRLAFCPSLKKQDVTLCLSSSAMHWCLASEIWSLARYLMPSTNISLFANKLTIFISKSAVPSSRYFLLYVICFDAKTSSSLVFVWFDLVGRSKKRFLFQTPIIFEVSISPDLELLTSIMLDQSFFLTCPYF